MQSSGLESISFTSSSMWGPDPSFILEEYRGLPFNAYNKLEKLGRFADPATSVKAQPDGEEFKNMDDGPINIKPKNKPKPIAKPNNNWVPNYNNRYNPRYPKNKSIKTNFKDSAGVQTDWEHIIEVSKGHFEKTPAYNVKVNDLLTVGKVPVYDKSWEGKLTGKKTNAFALPDSISIGINPTQDKFITEQSKAVDEESEEVFIYSNDSVLSAILSVKASQFPWDVYVVKKGNQLFFESSRQNKTSYIDILTVNENTTSGNLPEDEKDMLKICVESTRANKKFVQLTSRENDFHIIGDDSEYIKEAENKALRYRKWTIDNKTHVICRSEIEACVRSGEGENAKYSFAKVCALSEYEAELDWRTNVETNRGAVLAAEFRNNSCKIARWLCQATLADCEHIKLGFVSKASQKDSKYQVLTTEPMTTAGLAKSFNYSIKDNWSIIKTIVDVLNKQEDGTFVFVKSPYKQSIKIYRLPEEDEEEN